MKKKNYNEPTMEVVCIEAEDVICTSDNDSSWIDPTDSLKLSL